MCFAGSTIYCKSCTMSAFVHPHTLVLILQCCWRAVLQLALPWHLPVESLACLWYLATDLQGRKQFNKAKFKPSAFKSLNSPLKIVIKKIREENYLAKVNFFIFIFFLKGISLPCYITVKEKLSCFVSRRIQH